MRTSCFCGDSLALIPTGSNDTGKASSSIVAGALAIETVSATQEKSIRSRLAGASLAGGSGSGSSCISSSFALLELLAVAAASSPDLVGSAVAGGVGVSCERFGASSWKPRSCGEANHGNA